MDELPKQYEHAAAQDRWYPVWEGRGYFNSDPDPKRKPFTIVIPPPNVTGALHLGHALNNSLQDILVRFKRMQGYNALWMPGTDHAGIATQAVVERRLLAEEKLSRHDLGREKLVERIWTWKDAYERRILDQLKQMGCSCDWRRTRFTLDETCARAVRNTFFRMFQDKLIYRGKRLVNWDTFLQTAVSDDEVFHETVKGAFWHFRYEVIGPKPGEPTHVTIATTRPETMLGDTAVAVHPDPAAALDKVEAELREKLASAPEKERDGIRKQLEDLTERRRTLLPQLIQLRDMARDGRMVMLPIMKRAIPLVADEWAKPELGTGCVKITPAHDPNDYEVGLRQELPMINILNPDGTLNANAGRHAGFTIPVARKRVVAEMEELGLLEKTEDREIDLAHSDRSKTPIEPYLADQWFVRMDELAQSAMDAVSDGRVKIVPGRYAKGYLDWLGEKRDWPVSRQLWWGHRIPVWTSKPVRDLDGARALEKRARDKLGGRDGVAYTVQAEERGPHVERAADSTGYSAIVAGPDCHVHVCLREDDPAVAKILEDLGFVQSEDVLDTWFSSALWPHSTLGWPEKTPELGYYYPTSVLITSRDIITLWVARMVLTGLYNVGDAPFREVFIHPKILDRDGETMSKSKGNGVDPLDVIEKFGADALRFGLAYLTTETQDVRMPVDFECPHCHVLVEQTKKNRELPRIACKKCGGEFSTQWATKEEDKALPRGAVVSERFEVARNFANKLWNASRFSLMNLEGYTPGAVAESELTLEDRWVLSRLNTVTRQVTEALETFHYSEAARALYDFAWDEFCSFYVEMLKPRLGDATLRPTAQRVLAHTLDTLLRLLQPIMPFITEEVWQLLGGIAPKRGLDGGTAAADSVMIAPWPACDAARIMPEIETSFARFQAVLVALRDVRARNNIAPKETIEFSARCDEATAALLEPMAPYFATMAKAHATAWGPAATAPEMSASATLPGMEVFVDLRGFIDVKAEIARHEKERDNLAKLIVGKQSKLGNASFVERAPPAVVEQERESLAQLEKQRESVVATLEKLRAM
ncbi:MAG: valine--tRNA ligase [Planctomycetota bacterium]|nr:MAG: valine--tRNA ligase [Planctomycetota bacterium]